MKCSDNAITPGIKVIVRIDISQKIIIFQVIAYYITPNYFALIDICKLV